jgi:hypothetical protein
MRATGLMLGLWCLWGTAIAQEPLQVRNGRAFSLAFLRLSPRTEIDTKRAEWRLLLANDVRLAQGKAGLVEEDYEVARLEGSFFRDLGPSTQLEVRLALQSISGGVFDPLIEAWHSAILQWRREEREGVPFGRSIIRSPGNPTFGTAFGIADTQFQLNKAWKRGVWSLAIKLPTGNARKLLGSGGVDVGVGLGAPLLAKGRLSISAAIAGIWQGSTRDLKGEREFVDQETLSLHYRSRANQTWVIQYQSEASALKLGVPASDAAHRIIVFGWRKEYANGDRLELFFAEDRDLFEGAIRELADVGPDFSLGVNWVVRW